MKINAAFIVIKRLYCQHEINLIPSYRLLHPPFAFFFPFQRYSKNTRQHTCTTGIKWVSANCSLLFDPSAPLNDVCTDRFEFFWVSKDGPSVHLGHIAHESQHAEGRPPVPVRTSLSKSRSDHVNKWPSPGCDLLSLSLTWRNHIFICVIQDVTLPAYLSSGRRPFANPHMGVDQVTVHVLSIIKALLGKKVKACFKLRDKSALPFRVHKGNGFKPRKTPFNSQNDMKKKSESSEFF